MERLARTLFGGYAVAEMVGPLALELLAWIAGGPRTYGETMEAWRSHCPRQSVWEDALDQGLIEISGGGGTVEDASVTLTDRGRAVLSEAS